MTFQKYWPFFLNRPVWRRGDNGDRRVTFKIRLWNFNEHTFWHKYTTLYSPCLYRASICAWRIFSPGTTMAGRVRDLRRGAGLPPTGFTSGATPAHPLLQKNMMKGYALRDQWPIRVRYPSQVRSTKIICNRSTNRSVCCKQDTYGPDQIFKAPDFSKYSRLRVQCLSWQYTVVTAKANRTMFNVTVRWRKALWGKTPFFWC